MKIRRLICVLLSIVIAISFSSCSKKDGSNVVIKWPISASPKNLDPQMAQDEPSLQVIANMFEGLMRKTGNSVENAMAQSYTVSEDGLVYTFNLKNNYYWISKDKNFKVNVTAKDFVFSFRRIADPVTHSPYAKTYSMIKNATAINQNGADVTTLGVEAVSDYVLKITLEKPYSAFLSLLSESSAYPCNEEFFYSTKGKYGLEVAATASNGPFYLHDWLNDEYGKSNYLILRRSSAYNEFDTVSPSGLNFFVNTDKDSIYDNFKKKTYSVVLGDSSEKRFFEKEYKNNEFKTKTVGLIINPDNAIIADSEIRKSLSLSLDRNKLKNSMTNGVSVSGGIVPPSVSILNKSFRELVSEPLTDTVNIPLAQLLWTSTLSVQDKNLINNYSIIAPSDFEYREQLDKALEQWGEALGFFPSVEVLSEKDYMSRLTSGEYNIALYTIDSKFNSPIEYLNHFYNGSDKNMTKVNSAEFNGLLDKAANSEMLNNSVIYYQQAEKYILDNYLFIPLFYESEFMFYNAKSSGYEYDPFTNQIFFKKVKSLA